MWFRATVFLGFFCWLSAGCALRPADDASSARNFSAEQRRDWEERLTPDALDRARLAEAIFAETNQARVAAGLPALRGWSRLDAAAEMQASVGAVFRPPSHTNPFAMMATPVDRVTLAGIKPKQVAENIALLPCADAPDGVAALSRTEAGLQMVDAISLQPLENHTYGSFARRVVAAWMRSPGHRANILDRGLTHLGCAVAATQSMEGVPMIFAVQVFCTPADRR